MRQAMILLALLALSLTAWAATPTDNPVTARYADKADAVPAWVNTLPWATAVSVADFPGANDNERFSAAQAALVAKGGGGVVFFPAGTYTFKDSLELENGVILRGETPALLDAKLDTYALTTRFEFPKYTYSAEGNGTPNDTAFKDIHLKSAKECANVGVVNIAINRGHIYFAEDAEHNTAKNRVVFGNILTNTAGVAGDVPNPDYKQLPNQRWTARHLAAIHIFGENVFIANNRIPKSADDNFVMADYALVRVTNGKGQDFNVKNPAGKPFVFETAKDVTFDYDNRPGVYLNPFGIGSFGHGSTNGTPETHPFGFRKGGIVRDNYIYNSGRCAVFFSGDGTYMGFNIIRFPEGLKRPTTTGLVASDGSATNDNRALTARGYRWVVEGNDYVVFSNVAYGGQKINDGEGLMHENHDNSAVRDAKLINNTGNRYLCLWVMDIDGLLISGNKVTAGGAAINILSNGRPVKNLTIINNELPNGDINVTGNQLLNITVKDNKVKGSISVTQNPPPNIVVSGNTHTDPIEGKLTVSDLCWSADNTGYAEALPVVKPK